MADIAVTKMSSKGQIVIPNELRKGLKEGDKFVIIRSDKQIIMKRTSDFDDKLIEDLIFADRTEKAYKRYENGQFKSMDYKEFLKALKKW